MRNQTRILPYFHENFFFLNFKFFLKRYSLLNGKHCLASPTCWWLFSQGYKVSLEIFYVDIASWYANGIRQCLRNGERSLNLLSYLRILLAAMAE